MTTSRDPAPAALTAEEIEIAQRNATSSFHLARAVLGDAAVIEIVARWNGQPNNMDTRREIIEAISDAVREKISAVTSRGADPWQPPS